MLGMSVSGYYAWRARTASRRQRQDLIFLAHMRGHFACSNRTYGSPRIHADLKAQGLAIGRHRVARLMRDNGLRALQRRRPKRTTDSQHNNPVAPNLLEQDFTATGPNQKWGSDISYIWTAEGWLYLAIVVDLYSRRIVGWAVGVRLRKELLWLPYKELWSCAGRRRVWCSILIAAANIASALTRRCCVMQASPAR
jgi:transposase InsO family protein